MGFYLVMDKEIEAIHDNLNNIRDAVDEQMEALKALGEKLGTSSKKVPDENTPMGTRVLFRDNEDSNWTKGRFINYRYHSDDYHFSVLSDEDNETDIYNFCHIALLFLRKP